MTHDITHIDLFSGIGGFALAARNAGFRTVAFSELDPYASAVLRKHWPDVPNLGDIKTADFGPCAGATLLTGGFPCQPFSCAGKQRGKEDDRFLWPAMLAAIATVKPAWIVGENVTGIIRMELDRVLADLEAQGYAALPIVIPACAVDAKHRRDRVWIVANASGRRFSGTGEGQIQLPRGAETVGACETLANREGLGRGEVLGRSQGPGGHVDECCEKCGDRGWCIAAFDDGRACYKCSRGHYWESSDVADADILRGGEESGALPGTQGPPASNEGRRGWSESGNCGETVADTNGEQLARRWPRARTAGRNQSSDPCRWPTEPPVGRVVNGLPRRVDRIKGLGNAIVPQVAFQILKAIADLETK